jgi:hypothetical protein
VGLWSLSTNQFGPVQLALVKFGIFHVFLIMPILLWHVGVLPLKVSSTDIRAAGSILN